MLPAHNHMSFPRWLVDFGSSVPLDQAREFVGCGAQFQSAAVLLTIPISISVANPRNIVIISQHYHVALKSQPCSGMDGAS